MKNKKDVHPHDRWVKLWEVQDSLLRRAANTRRSITLPIYGTAVDGPTASRQGSVCTRIETHKSADSGYGYEEHPEDGRCFVGDYVVPSEEKVAQFGDAYFGTIAGHYLSQYVGGDRSIDRVSRYIFNAIGAFFK